ncbi:unnamed protein product [Ranitomeya imitator]|uniref:Peptidase C19 ubiquitin carboxyl-terminal hydrolase domain-containing protein n=1 Tax=Ranitomeya imitator TaxID=111125 RepID=A0ABN9MFF9_9NEOB|nr:unnamed protein product [Ranitomeya imitator]
MFGDLFEEDEDFSFLSNNTANNGRKAKSKDEILEPRGETRLRGLRNQGSTCYLNSLLQTLLFTPEFREALFALRPEELGSLDEKDVPDSKVPSYSYLYYMRVIFSCRGSGDNMCIAGHDVYGVRAAPHCITTVIVDDGRRQKLSTPSLTMATVDSAPAHRIYPLLRPASWCGGAAAWSGAAALGLLRCGVIRRWGVGSVALRRCPALWRYVGRRCGTATLQRGPAARGVRISVAVPPEASALPGRFGRGAASWSRDFRPSDRAVGLRPFRRVTSGSGSPRSKGGKIEAPASGLLQAAASFGGPSPLSPAMHIRQRFWAQHHALRIHLGTRGDTGLG